MSLSSVDRSLINSKFEGYKLELIAQEDAVSRYPLEHVPSQATISGRSPLSFQEVYSRITHNHMVPSPSQETAIYVDAEYRINIVNTISDPPTVSILYELPKPLKASGDERHHEYPSAAFLDADNLLVSDGHGLLYCVRISTTDLRAIFECDDSRPFRIHSASIFAPDSATVIISSRHYDPAQPAEASKKHINVNFDVQAVSFSWPQVGEPILQAQKLSTRWTRRGKTVPKFTSHFPSCSSYLLIGGSQYNEVDSPMQELYDPSPDEIVPIPRVGENLDNSSAPKPPPPYSWAQTSDSVTVAFPLPSTTNKTDISVLFTSKTLTLHVKSPSTTPAIPLPHYSTKEFWDGIDASATFWTWDREGTNEYGLLSLHIEKKHEGTKWVQIFANDSVEVAETLDPSELWHIREALEKYTSSLKEGGADGLGAGMPSLADGEMDEDIDSSAGKESYLTWVDTTGRTPIWFDPDKQVPFQLLSTPLPGFDLSSFVIKNSLDGVVYSIAGDETPSIKHTSTFSALAFVLASKQDTRFTFHNSKTVFAFENGLRDRGGNLYIYRAPAAKGDKWAKQSVVQIMDGSSGSLLGVCTIKSGSVILALTDKELVMLKGIL